MNICLHFCLTLIKVCSVVEILFHGRHQSSSNVMLLRCLTKLNNNDSPVMLHALSQVGTISSSYLSPSRALQ